MCVQYPSMCGSSAGLRNATEITSPSGLPYRPSSVLRQQLHSSAMRLLPRLEYERLYGASWSTYFVRIPNVFRFFFLGMPMGFFCVIGLSHGGAESGYFEREGNHYPVISFA